MARQYQKQEDLRLGEELPPCTRSFKSIYGLLCAHEIQKALKNGPRTLKIEAIDEFWRWHKSAGYGKRQQVIEIPDNPVDPVLQVREPATSKEKGRPRGSQTSIVRNLSHFELVEAEYNMNDGGGSQVGTRSASMTIALLTRRPRDIAITAAQVARDEENKALDQLYVPQEG